MLDCLTWKGDQGRIWKRGLPSLEKGHCGHSVEDGKERKLLICWEPIAVSRGKGQWSGGKRETRKGASRNHGNKHSVITLTSPNLPKTFSSFMHRWF